ncbi:PXA domain-containing protein [Schizophyllum fasciatum]
MALEARRPPNARSIASGASDRRARTKGSAGPAPLAKRLLFPHLPSPALPPLLTAPARPAALDDELYDFIALALRAFVNPWWTKITRYDKEFLPDITRILTHVLRALEARALAADPAPLLLRDIPLLVTQHVRDYRDAECKACSAYASGGALSLPQLFHQLQPHLAVTPDGRIHDEYFRQVVDQILKAVLPAKDYAPEAERFIVREIIVKIVANDILPRVTQPWFINNVLLGLLKPDDAPQVRLLPCRTACSLTSSQPPAPRSQTAPDSKGFSLHRLIVLFLSAIQAVSTACLALTHAYKRVAHTVKLVNESAASPTTSPSPSPRIPHDVPPTAIPASISVTPIISPTPSVSSIASSAPTPAEPADAETTAEVSDFASPALNLLEELFATDDRLAARTIMSSVHLSASAAQPFLDKFLRHTISQTLSGDLVLSLVRTGKRLLFPNGYPQPSPPDPTAEEQARTRERIVRWQPIGALDPFSDATCNMHLVVIILERVLCELFPELVGGTMPGDIEGKSG